MGCASPRGERRRPAARRRCRSKGETGTRRPTDDLGPEPDDVILTHLHYDHAGNLGLFDHRSGSAPPRLRPSPPGTRRLPG
ncbi:MBL fold metallo-hydrolase [Pseudonocardia sp.]|uniref:MBL fold metallo-hydrolase n=1 Tax=Pseudonocardia sp. TaxID=60912 RepID=UPI003451613A